MNIRTRWTRRRIDLVTYFLTVPYSFSIGFTTLSKHTFWPSLGMIGIKMWTLDCRQDFLSDLTYWHSFLLYHIHFQLRSCHHQCKLSDQLWERLNEKCRCYSVNSIKCWWRTPAIGRRTTMDAGHSIILKAHPEQSSGELKTAIEWLYR